MQSIPPVHQAAVQLHRRDPGRTQHPMPNRNFGSTRSTSEARLNLALSKYWNSVSDRRGLRLAVRCQAADHVPCAQPVPRDGRAARRFARRKCLYKLRAQPIFRAAPNLRCTLWPQFHAAQRPFWGNPQKDTAKPVTVRECAARCLYCLSEGSGQLAPCVRERLHRGNDLSQRLQNTIKNTTGQQASGRT